MPVRPRPLLLPILCAALALPVVALVDPPRGAASPRTPLAPGTGGAPLGGGTPVGHRPIAPPRRRGRGRWLARVTVTEYWPAPESWFVGRPVSAPGLPGRHRIDWLYSAGGVSMNGVGIGLDGRTYRIADIGDGGWVTAAGRRTVAHEGFRQGVPYWRSGAYWRNRAGAVTFPLAAGGWSRGPGRRHVALHGVRFATGAAGSGGRLVLGETIAVDPSVIPMGSRVYIPAYRHDRHGGWFLARDTGSAIVGRHVDVYRRPPSSPTDSGGRLTGQRIYVIAPRHRRS